MLIFSHFQDTFVVKAGIEVSRKNKSSFDLWPSNPPKHRSEDLFRKVDTVCECNGTRSSVDAASNGTKTAIFLIARNYCIVDNFVF